MTQSGNDNGPANDDIPNAYILVAEDDHIAQLVIKKMLEEAAYKVDLVGDGKAAISALTARNYDLVLMDCFMPQMDGFAATRFIRNAGSSRINSKIPVIALTGLTTKEDQLKCRDAGMDHYVSKPVDSGALMTAIEQCLGRATVKETAPQQREKPGEQNWDDEFLDTIINNFLAEVPQVLVDLHQARNQGDVIKLRHIGHRLRGASDILDAVTLSARSEALEQAGKAGDHVLAGRLALELVEELHKLTDTLTE